MGAAAAWLARLTGMVVVCGFGAAGIALAGPRPSGYLHGSIYPWWTWLLVVAGVLSGAVLLLAPARHMARTAAACVAFVVGAELAGTGVVARVHWKPASGMASYGAGQLPDVERLAVQIALGAGVATLAAAGLLLATRTLSTQHWDGSGWGLVTVALGLAALLPLVLASSEVGGPRVTTWGAAGLIYAGPWSVAVAASAWSHRHACSALLSTVLGCASIATIGPQMVDLFTGPGSSGLFLVVAMMLALSAVVAARRSAVS